MCTRVKDKYMMLVVKYNSNSNGVKPSEGRIHLIQKSYLGLILAMLEESSDSGLEQDSN